MTSGIPKGKKRQTPEERKAKKKEYDSRPENIVKKKAYATKYRQSPEGKLRQKRI